VSDVKILPDVFHQEDRDAVSSLKTNKQSIGYTEFGAVLKNLHTPRAFISDRNQVGGQAVIRGKLTDGPPGQRQKPKRKSSFKWIRY